MGRFLKYIVYIDNVPVSCIGFTGAALKVKDRDNFIGWENNTKIKNLKHIVNNFRFVIFPWVRIKYLASHILGKLAILIPEDWKKQYNVEIYLFETFVEKGRFIGTSYKAANWKYIGITKGYAKTKEGWTKHGVLKDVFIYPVCKDFKEKLNKDGKGSIINTVKSTIK